MKFRRVGIYVWILGALVGGCRDEPDDESDDGPDPVEESSDAAGAGQEGSPSAPEEKGASAGDDEEDPYAQEPSIEPDSGTGDIPQDLASTGESPWVAVPGELSLCDQDADCAVADTACDGCCAVGAINEASLATFTEKKDAACSVTASAGECECTSPSVVTVCDSYRGQCVLIPSDGPKEGDSDCFSPFQNIDQAYVEGSEGCACEAESALCVAGAALICEDGQWSATQDGPCQPRVGDVSDGCSAGERYPSAQLCMEAHATCQLGEDGFFCGLE